MISKYVKEPSAKVGENLLPVSLLCGFLGAGKTTLLKHVLETKHAEENFKCAVIVNDMAALNIDKSLIDQSALVQTDEVIAMQNGCFCCTLQNDLVEQIKELAQKKIFNYMLIEASGVSEPSQIAPLFDDCDDEHDHEEEHPEGPQLAEVARLDTCITVVDAAEFYNNLDSMKVYEEGEIQGTIAELMTEQVEFANVVILNKQDLVSEDQKTDILDRIHLLNPKAKVLHSLQSKVNVKEILNTNLYSRADMEENSVMISATKVDKVEEAEAEPECCIKSADTGKPKCCKKKAKNGQIVDSGLSEVLLGVVPVNFFKDAKKTRHEERFGISSFVYRSRRPFHPGRLYNEFLDPYFMMLYEEQETGIQTEEQIEKLQKMAGEKKKKRVALMGELLRSKGFVWTATAHFVMGGLQQAGNVCRVEAEGPWMCVVPDMWENTPNEELVIKDMTDPKTGEKYPFEDRRQELVFIGVNMKHEAIQSTLDRCLLTNEEMELKPEIWLDKWEAEDKIGLALEESEDEEDEDEEGEEGDEDDEDQDEKEQSSDKVQNGSKGKKNKKETQKVDKDESEPPVKKTKVKNTIPPKKKQKS